MSISKRSVDHKRRSLLRAGAVGAMMPFMPVEAFAQSEDGAADTFPPGAVALTQVLSQFVAGASYDKLPADAVMAAKRGILDTLGVVLAANQEQVATIIRRYVRGEGGDPVATVLTGGFQTDAGLAALANGTMAHALDYDNVIHAESVWLGHPSVVILPAALAAAEERKLSGKDLILGYCLGLEIYTKVGLICGDQAYQNGWHNTSYIGTVAAAGTVARLYGLPEPLIEQCFGIAGSMAGGMRQNFGTMTKPLHAGLAARNGIQAATLAQAGLTASQHIFEATLGFRNIFSGSRGAITNDIPYGYGTITLDVFRSKLGAPWSVASPGLSYKICPSCRDSNYGMEAGLAFRRAKPFDVQQIDKIVCHVPRQMGDVLFYHDPKKGLEGKFSLEYVLARTLLDGVPKISDFTDTRVNQPEAQALIRKMKWVTFEASKDQHGIPDFTINARDGQIFRVRPVHLTGEAENPVSNAFLTDKFKDCASHAVTAEQADRIAKLTFDLENVQSVAELTGLMRT